MSLLMFSVHSCSRMHMLSHGCINERARMHTHMYTHMRTHARTQADTYACTHTHTHAPSGRARGARVPSAVVEGSNPRE